MGKVRAKTDVYLGATYGLRRKDETFDYEGEDNEHLEAVEPAPYDDFSPAELKAELADRSIPLPPGDNPKRFSDLLEADDAAPKTDKKVRARKDASVPVSAFEPTVIPSEESHPEHGASDAQ